MRRGFHSMLALAALAWLSPSVYAQYPYPYPPPGYGPVPMQQMPMQQMPMQMPMQQMPMQPYGYPPQMMRPPVYMPNPMMARPTYYYPPPPMAQGQPVPPYPPANGLKVNTYGPLQNENATPATTIMPANATPAQPANGVIKTNFPPKANSTLVGCGPGGCGPAGCGTGACAADGCGVGGCCPTGGCDDGCNACLKPPPLPRPHPCGHFVGMIGVNFLAPYPETRSAYTTTTATSATTTNFPSQLDFAPYFSLGYVFHNGYGVRGDFWFLHGTSSLSATNTDPTVVINTPGAPPFRIASPNPANPINVTLLEGVGADQFSFRRTFDFKVADLEVIKECHVFDMFITLGAGARYAFMSQGYNATRTNVGGINQVTGTAVSQDREDLSLLSVFEGLGPTLSLELVHPMKGSCFSFYGNARGSVLFGVERFHQDYQNQNVTLLGGVPPPTFTNANNNTESVSNRTVSVVELELGIQVGQRCGPCYIFGRIGGIYSRWWDVGSATGANGNLDLVGGTVKLGIIY